MSSGMKGLAHIQPYFLPLCSYHSLPYATKSRGKDHFFFAFQGPSIFGCLIEPSLTVIFEQISMKGMNLADAKLYIHQLHQVSKRQQSSRRAGMRAGAEALHGVHWKQAIRVQETEDLRYCYDLFIFFI